MDKVIILQPLGHTITVTLTPDDCGGSGTINSDLVDTVINADDKEWETAMDAIESLILALACSGADIESPRFLEGLETAIDGIANNI